MVLLLPPTPGLEVTAGIKIRGKGETPALARAQE
jgi:hypothetical protein